jgi:protein-S-isoprenylcysteine O-methyltransferase Ste14
MFLAGLVMMKKSPDLLRRRLDAREEQAEQKAVIALSGLMFLAAFPVAGLNFRFGWIVLPAWVSYAAAVLFLLAYALYAEVLRENVCSPGRLKCRRTRRLSTPDFTVLSDTRCTCVHFCCFFQCRWCLAQ